MQSFPFPTGHARYSMHEANDFPKRLPAQRGPIGRLLWSIVLFWAIVATALLCL